MVADERQYPSGSVSNMDGSYHLNQSFLEFSPGNVKVAVLLQCLFTHIEVRFSAMTRSIDVDWVLFT